MSDPLPSETFAQRLKTWRGTRQPKEVADILGVSVWVYYNWELGRNEPPPKLCRNCIERLLHEKTKSEKPNPHQ